MTSLQLKNNYCNMLTFNVTKISFMIHGNVSPDPSGARLSNREVELTNVNRAKLLGINIAENPKFNNNEFFVLPKPSSVIGIIYKEKTFRSKATTMFLYMSLGWS